jgi:hypothetical protein
MMPSDPLRDMMRRTMDNLEFVERRAAFDGPFEVAQLINSFLGAFAHPWERLEPDLKHIPLTQAIAQGWPEITSEEAEVRPPKNLDVLIRRMRNAVAHGNLEWLPDEHNAIAAVRIWNTKKQQDAPPIRTWEAVISIIDMRRFLDCFVRLAEEIQTGKPNR